MFEPVPQKGKTEKLEELIANNNQNDGGVLYIEDKDSDLVKRIIKCAEESGRSLDVHILDFPTEKSASINLETGVVTPS